MGVTHRAPARARRGAMTDNSRVTLRWTVAAILAVLLVATGAGAAYLLIRGSQRPAPPPKATSDEPAMPTSHSAGQGAPPSPGRTPTAPGAALPDVTVTLTKEAVDRAGIKVTAVSTGD